MVFPRQTPRLTMALVIAGLLTAPFLLGTAFHTSEKAGVEGEVGPIWAGARADIILGDDAPALGGTRADITPDDEACAIFRGGLNRTGVSPYRGPANSGLLYTFSTNRKQIQSSPVVAGDRVYFGSDSNDVYCVNIANGAEVWTFETGNQVLSSPTMCGGVLYVGSSDGNLHAINSEFGEKIWSFHIEEKYGQIVSSPVVVEGVVYFGSDEGAVYALNAETGKQIWRTTGGDEFWASPTVVDGRVLIGGLDGVLLCLDAADGSEIWRYAVDVYEGIYSTACVVESPADGQPRVIFSTALYDNHTYCLKLSDGSLDWRFRPDGPIYASPAVHDGVVFIHAWGQNDSGANLWALPLVDPSPGDREIRPDETLWHSFTGDVQGGSSPTVADGRVYVGSDHGMGGEGKLFCFNETTGKMHWNQTTEGDVYSTPWVQHGLAFIGSNGGELYVFGGDGDAETSLVMEVEDAQVYSNRTTALSFKVTYRGFPVHGAMVTVESSHGGLAQSGATTFPDGTQRIKFAAPRVTERTLVIFTAKVDKQGYPPAEANGSLIVLPLEEKDLEGSSGGGIAWSKYSLLLGAMGVLTALNIIVFALLFIRFTIRRRVRRMGGENDGGGKGGKEGGAGGGGPAGPVPMGAPRPTAGKPGKGGVHG